jgi:hypothetical protein
MKGVLNEKAFLGFSKTVIKDSQKAAFLKAWKLHTARLVAS